MPILKKYHRYINKNLNSKPIPSKYIAEITPLQDMEVPQKLYDDFVEIKNGEPVKKVSK
ncbi:MAG: hypothetical protein KA886_04430 [Candidatus Cloacimonetes bacterium]|nr:hypothetical protein [Candidatus Cloacimonadota bacterium]